MKKIINPDCDKWKIEILFNYYKLSEKTPELAGRCEFCGEQKINLPNDLQDLEICISDSDYKKLIDKIITFQKEKHHGN